MKIEDVKNLPPLERFLYWIRERHNIYLRRKAGREKPWTDDEILRNYFFTNPYRENDKVTDIFRRSVRDPMRDDPRVLFATVAWRWFNYPPTGEILHRTSLLTEWNPERCLSLLRPIRDAGTQIFTGAFMINSPAGEPKLEAIVRRIDGVWKEREHLLAHWDDEVTMEGMHSALTTFDGLGGFMAYEVVCDLRYTYLLENAKDKETWCHVGPGARRGLYRTLGIDFPKGNNAAGCPRVLSEEDELKEMRKLLEICRTRLRGMPRFEMREIEHSLCEFDKYERLLWNDGRAKRTYPGGK